MVKVTYERQKEFLVHIRDHRLICDQPLDGGGGDHGPAPAEWFGASIASCIAYYVLSYLQARSLPTAGLEVETSWETVAGPRRMGSIRTRVLLPEGVPEVNHDRILRAAGRCLIHNTLHHPPELSIDVCSVTSAAAIATEGQPGA